MLIVLLVVGALLCVALGVWLTVYALTHGRLQAADTKYTEASAALVEAQRHRQDAIEAFDEATEVLDWLWEHTADMTIRAAMERDLPELMRRVQSRRVH